MENVTVFVNPDGIEWVSINLGNGEFTSMLKSTYDEMIAAQEQAPTL